MVRRLYDLVRVDKTPDGRFAIWLDRRQLKTRGGVPLSLPSQSLADIIAQEWAAQGEAVLPQSMPITRLVNVAIDQTPQRRDEIIDEITRYGETDLLLYRTSQTKELATRQARAWDPILKWAQDQGIDLKTTSSIAAIKQDAEALARLGEFAQAMPDIELTLFGHFTSVFGSAILALAVMQGYLTAEEAFDVSRVDEIYQAEHWGEDEQAKSEAQALKDETSQIAQLLSI